GGRADAVPVRDAVEPDTARSLHLARPAGPRPARRPRQRPQRRPAPRLRLPRHRGAAARLPALGAGRLGAVRAVAPAAVSGRRRRVLLPLPPGAAGHTGRPVLGPGRYPVPGRDAVRPRGTEPRRAAVRGPDRLVRAVVLHLRAAVRADPARRARRRRAHPPPAGPPGL